MSRSLGLLEKLGGKKGDKKGGAGALAADLSLAALVVAGLAVAVGLFISRAREVGAVNEDAFISFRYAQNLLAGGGLVFNPDGQRVEGIRTCCGRSPAPGCRSSPRRWDWPAVS